VNVRSVLVSDLLGFSSFIVVVALSLVGRRGFPFDIPSKVARAWRLLWASVAIAGIGSLMATALAISVPWIIVELPAGALAGAATFIWIARFPAHHVLWRRVRKPPAPLMQPVTPAPSTAEPVARAGSANELRFDRSEWPARLWSSGTIWAPMSTPPDATVGWMESAVKGRSGLSIQLRSPYDEESESSGVMHLRHLAWPPSKWWSANAEIAMSVYPTHSGGSVVVADVLVPHLTQRAAIALIWILQLAVIISSAIASGSVGSVIPLFVVWLVIGGAVVWFPRFGVGSAVSQFTDFLRSAYAAT
jgi:hypothetical protein